MPLVLLLPMVLVLPVPLLPMVLVLPVPLLLMALPVPVVSPEPAAEGRHHNSTRCQGLVCILPWRLRPSSGRRR